mgnify:FL=1
MAVKKKGLGRGLDALFPEKSVKPAEKKPEQKSVATNESLHQQEEGSLNASAVKSAAETKDTAQAAVVEEPKKSEMLVKISKVEPNRTQPRKQFDEDALLELSESIKQFGILQPLLVSDKGDYYEIIAGERRWRAAKLAGVKEVPVIIKEFNDQQVVEISLIENIQREDLNPIEEAMAYKRLIDEFKVDGVVEMTLQACHTYNVESLAIRKFVNEKKGIPYINVETDYSQADIGQLNTRIAAFIEML